MPQTRNTESLCPKILLPLKDLILDYTSKIRKSWEAYWKSHPEIFSETHWVRWTPPQEMLEQLWEWRPLQNLRFLVELTFPGTPIHTLQTILLILTLTLLTFVFTRVKVIYLKKRNAQRDVELIHVINMHKIIYPKSKISQSITYPSPNYHKAKKLKRGRNAKQYDFGSYYGYITLCSL